MKKSIIGVSLLALIASSPLSAQYAGPNYWAASADTPNSTMHTGIVVTDSTYAACVNQFSAAMASHTSAHGDVFSNIHNCHYVSNSYNPGVNQAHLELNYINGGTTPLPHDIQTALTEKFIENMSGLEEQYQVAEFIKQRDALLEKHFKRVNKEKSNYK